ncbi:hypothetical protein [Saccharothrix violaceirubra]|uniref:Uncharacterized protein n=1 Tax=Saccharothrix violaceirubra TaxID=413306 RepID=A0A7W7T220_9PSEU|nr:hypothetical protein [Saccharothrix violaceirubra]MBB4965109.1 hypothetical protein [Saccharothrix violaceirubra]
MTRSFAGRMAEVRLVGRLLDRDPGSPTWPPVLVYEGAAAAGKTDLLRDLDERSLGTVPSVRLDLAALEAELDDEPLPRVLAAIAFGLSRQCRLYGSLRFDRLVVGMLARALALDGVDPRAAARQVTEMLKERRGLTTLKQALGEVAQDALAFVPGGAPGAGVVTGAVGFVVDRLSTWTATRGTALGRHVTWYGDQDRGLDRDPVEVLVELNRADRRDAEDLLVDAFVADLRDDFRTGRHSSEWTMNCLLLLDGADTGLGRALVDALHAARRRQVARGVVPDTPLAVVAASRGGLLSALSKVERATVHTLTAHDTPLPEDRRVVWLRRVLPPLSPDEVYETVRGLGIDGQGHRTLASVLHQLTGGHPGGTHLVLDAVAAEGTTVVDPEKLLRSGVEERLGALLLGDVDDAALDVLVTCSAARDHAEAMPLVDRFDDVLPAGMWTADTHTTLLRLLLLRRLARRPDDHPDGRRAVHRGLRLSAEQRGDLAGRLHHALAADDADHVVAVLDDRLDTDRLTDWLALLDAVVTAPRPPGASADPAPGDPVRVLVTALRIVTDPVCGVGRGVLHWRIAGAYRDLARRVGDRAEDQEGLLDLVDRVHHHEQLGRQWRRSGRRTPKEGP